MAKRKRAVSPALEAKRREARLYERRATNKMSSLRRGRGKVELRGTQWDVRKGADAISRMNTPQLNAHIARLSEFNSRKTQFMRTEEGIAGPDVAGPFLAAQRRVNLQRTMRLKKYGGVIFDGSDETLEQKYGVRNVKQRRMADPASDNPFAPLDKRGMRYKSPEAIMKMTEKFLRQLDPDNDVERRIKQQDTIDLLFQLTPMPRLEQAILEMDDEAFDLLMVNPEFWEDLSMNYHNAKLALSDSDAAFDDENMGYEDELLDRVAQAIRETMGR